MYLCLHRYGLLISLLYTCSRPLNAVVAPRTAVAQNQFSIAATHSVAVRLDLLRKRRVRYCLSFVTKQQLTLSCLRLRASFGVALNVTQM